MLADALYPLVSELLLSFNQVDNVEKRVPKSSLLFLQLGQSRIRMAFSRQRDKWLLKYRLFCLLMAAMLLELTKLDIFG
jgi:hypothetical protein